MHVLVRMTIRTFVSTLLIINNIEIKKSEAQLLLGSSAAEHGEDTKFIMHGYTWKTYLVES